MGPKFRYLVQKSDFCHSTPVLVNDPFLTLGMAVKFRPWERFFDFPFRSYSSSHKKKYSWPVKKPSPFLLWGHCLPVTALALSARKPFGPVRFARGLDNKVKLCNTTKNHSPHLETPTIDFIFVITCENWLHFAWVDVLGFFGSGCWDFLPWYVLFRSSQETLCVATLYFFVPLLLLFATLYYFVLLCVVTFYYFVPLCTLFPCLFFPYLSVPSLILTTD